MPPTPPPPPSATPSDLPLTLRTDAAQPSSRPSSPAPILLTIAIPTFNRSGNLALLLTLLAPQIAVLPQVELLISDNASPDDTEQVVERFLHQGLRCRYLRNPTNIQADANFLQCYAQARGKFLWIFGDDDVLFPDSLACLTRFLARPGIDLVYLTPFGFLHSPNERRRADPAPLVREFTDPSAFVHAVGLRGDFALISAVIVNRERVDSVLHPDFTLGRATNLVQLGWVFTALRHMRRALVFEAGLYAVCELNPSRPFDVAGVFGVNWCRAAQRALEPHSRLLASVLNDQLYSWFPNNWYGMRRTATHTHIIDPVAQMRPIYARRPLFWICTWPLLAWPMPLAGAWLALLRLVRHIDRFLHRRLHPPLLPLPDCP